MDEFESLEERDFARKERVEKYREDNKERLAEKRRAKIEAEASGLDLHELVPSCSQRSTPKEMRAYYNFNYYRKHKEELQARAAQKRDSMTEEEKEATRMYAKLYYQEHREEIEAKKKAKRPPKTPKLPPTPEILEERKLRMKEYQCKKYEERKTEILTEEEKAIVRAKRAKAMKKYRAKLKENKPK